MISPKESLHKKVVPSFAWGVLNELNAISILSKFYLAGGTGLALLLGHRRSFDFDFFSTALFNEEILIQEIKKLNNVTIISKDRHTLHIELKGIKVSFLGYTYPLLFHSQTFYMENSVVSGLSYVEWTKNFPTYQTPKAFEISWYLEEGKISSRDGIFWLDFEFGNTATYKRLGGSTWVVMGIWFPFGWFLSDFPSAASAQRIQLDKITYIRFWRHLVRMDV